MRLRVTWCDWPCCRSWVRLINVAVSTGYLTVRVVPGMEPDPDPVVYCMN